MIDWVVVGELSWTSKRALPIHQVIQTQEELLPDGQHCSGPPWQTSGRLSTSSRMLLTAATYKPQPQPASVPACLSTRFRLRSTHTPDLIDTTHQIDWRKQWLSFQSQAAAQCGEIQRSGDVALAAIAVYGDY